MQNNCFFPLMKHSADFCKVCYIVKGFLLYCVAPLLFVDLMQTGSNTDISGT